MYQDLSKRHDWPVKKPLFDWPIRLKGNSLSSLEVQNQGRNKNIQKGVAGTLASNIDPFYFTENSLKIKRYHRKRVAPPLNLSKRTRISALLLSCYYAGMVHTQIFVYCCPFNHSFAQTFFFSFITKVIFIQGAFKDFSRISRNFSIFKDFFKDMMLFQ